MSDPARVVIGDEEFVVNPGTPFLFGRSDAPGVVGLDPGDMGISAEAGAIELDGGVWWIANRSRKRRLLIDDGTTVQPRRLESLLRHAITVPVTTLLVPGAVFTHRLEILVAPGAFSSVAATASTTGTLIADALTLSPRDREALAALFSGYLRPFPHRDPRPRTYREAASQLGPPWTPVTVRKQIERLKEKLRSSQLYFEGPRANDELAEHLIAEGIITVADLSRIGETR